MEILRAIMANQVVAFIIVVGVVVFAHEFGHFIAARWLGILVEEFSIGFGPRAFGFRRGRTEYRIGWIPLGGYVRLFGAEPGREIPVEMRSQAVNTAARWKRFLVSAAGPAANVVVTFLFLSALSAVGIEKVPPRVSVLPGSVAASAGLVDGDLIEAIDGEPVRTWEELTEKVSRRPNELLHLDVLRGDGRHPLEIRPALVADESVFGEKVQVGRIGVSPYFQSPRVTVREGSPLWEAGLRFGDEIVAIDGRAVRHFHEVVQGLQAWSGHAGEGASLSLKIVRGGLPLPSGTQPREELSLALSPAQGQQLAAATWGGVGGLGFLSTDLAIAGFAEGEKGERQAAAIAGWSACGLVPGDAIVAAEGMGPVQSRIQLSQWVEKLEKGLSEESSRVPVKGEVWGSDGKQRALDCELPVRKGRDHLNRKKVFIDVPFRFVTQGTTAIPLLVKSEGVLGALHDGGVQTWTLAGNIFETIGKLVTGRIPMSNLGGPIEIARVAGTAASVGLLPFLYMIAFISLNVGLLNLLPIPVLDGGTLLLITLESLYGKPLPQRVQDVVQRFGIIFIVGLILLVIYNDVLRRIAS